MSGADDEFDIPDSPMNQVSAAIIGACIEVHRHLGPGFLESVYEEALATELRMRGIRFARQVPVAVMYKGLLAGEHRLDFVIEECVVLELKAIGSIRDIHLAIVLSYLKATGHKLGLLVNFHVALLKSGIKRVALR